MKIFSFKMKQFRLCSDFSILVICSFLGLSAAISACGEDVPRGKPSNPSVSIPDRFDIHGIVMDETPNHSPEILDKLERVASENSSKDFDNILDGMYKALPASNVVVTAESQSVTKKVVTDSQGKFKFIRLPEGDYELFAEMPSRPSGMGVKQMATGKEHLTLDSDRSVILQLRAGLIVVSGRITDVHGKPISGAKVTGKLEQFSEEGSPDTISAVSRTDGSYELSGFEPPDIYHIASFLAGGNPAVDYVPFYADIHVEADKLKGKARVLLVTEELLGPARRLLKTMSQMSLKKGGSEVQEKKDLPLPSSHGNTITGINIVLKKASEGVQ